MHLSIHFPMTLNKFKTYALVHSFSDDPHSVGKVGFHLIESMMAFDQYWRQGKNTSSLSMLSLKSLATK